MGPFLVYSTVNKVREKIDAFIKEKKFEKLSEEWEDSKICKVRAKDRISIIQIKAQWEIEKYDGHSLLKLKTKLCSPWKQFFI